MSNRVNSLHGYHLIAVFTLLLVCIACYSNTLNSPFVFDDFPNIKDNPYIRLNSLEFGKLYDAAFKSRSPNRPVANISFALNYFFGEYDPRGYHIVNVIVHLVNGILVYFLTLIIFRQLSDTSSQAPLSEISKSSSYPIGVMSLFTALIFIAHPIQTQSVTYIVQRMNGMAATFYLLSILLYIHGRLARIRWKRWALFSTCLLSGVMAIGSKEIALTLPFIILLYEWYFFQDLRTTWLKKNVIWFAVPVAIFFVIAFIYLHYHPFDRIAASYARRDFTMGERVLTQFRVIVFYISLLLYPHPGRLNLIHDVTTSHSVFDPITTLLSLLLIAGLVCLAVYLARRQRVVSFCILWFFINLFIESSFYGLEMIFEHRLYLPMFGFALLIVYLLFYLLSNRRLWAVVTSLIIVIPLAATSYMRNKIWEEEFTLWSDVVSKNPQSHRGHNGMGNALLTTDLDEAISYYQEALRLKPDFVEGHIGLGLALKKTGKLEEAISHYETALRINPKHVQAHINLAAALLLQGRLDEAISHSLKALRLRPDHIDAYNNLGNALVRQGRLDEAIKVLREAIRIEPDDVKAQSNLGVALMGKGQVKEAISHFSEALRIEPDAPRVHRNLGVALLQQGQLNEAISHFSEALRIKPDYEDARRKLEFARRLMDQSVSDMNTDEKRSGR